MRVYETSLIIRVESNKDIIIRVLVLKYKGRV